MIDDGEIQKAEGEEEDADAVGFQKEDIRACYMHFLMFLVMLITIVYAIVKAVIAQDVKFYYYYMYMIGKNNFDMVHLIF